MQKHIQVNILYPLPNQPGKALNFVGDLIKVSSVALYVRLNRKGRKSTTLLFNRISGRVMNSRPPSRKKGRGESIFHRLYFGGFVGAGS